MEYILDKYWKSFFLFYTEKNIFQKLFIEKFIG